MSRQFEDVNSKFGAPMGRRDFGQSSDCFDKIRLFRVRLDSGGYDDGGAYWGLGKPLYCAQDDGDFYRRFVRAASRSEAAELLELTNDELMQPIRSAA